MIPERRGIREDEAEVIRAALERALVAPVERAASAAISHLEVVARCECGCASVDFDSSPSDPHPTRIADGTGTTPNGGHVGIIVWGRRDAITGLEIYDLGAGEANLVLPVPTSVIPWEQNEAG